MGQASNRINQSIVQTRHTGPQCIGQDSINNRNNEEGWGASIAQRWILASHPAALGSILGVTDNLFSTALVWGK